MSQTLAQYFRSLREQSRKHPLLDRRTLEGMSVEALQAECRRRRYGLARGPGKRAGHAEWVKFIEARQGAERIPSLRDISRKSGVDVRMIWQLEHGQDAGVDTVKAALIEGLGLPANGHAVRKGLALWAAERTDSPQVGSDLFSSGEWRKEGAPPEGFDEFMRRLAPLLAKLPPEQYEAMLEAMGDPGVLEAIPALAKLARGRKV